jgi:hypothetical protein
MNENPPLCDRDMQYRDFAKSLIDELLSINNGCVWVETDSITPASVKWEEIIARRVYDLVVNGGK